MDRLYTSQLLASILSTTRYNANKSQEYMSMGLGVAKNTIYNWEKGTSCPTLIQLLQWFELLNINPAPYIFQLCNPNEIGNLKPSDSDKNIENALIKLVSSLTSEQKRGVLYLFSGHHGSDPDCVLQMLLADLHTQMANRVNVAQTIVDNYDICESNDTLVDTEHIMPNMDKLRIAVQQGKIAAQKKSGSYNIN